MVDRWSNTVTRRPMQASTRTDPKSGRAASYFDGVVAFRSGGPLVGVMPGPAHRVRCDHVESELLPEGA